MEIGVDDLAMDELEASALLASEGVELDPRSCASCSARRRAGRSACTSRRSRCWPGAAQQRDGTSFHGDDSLMADYFRAELLSRLTPDVVAFLTRTAVLDRLSGPLCEAVVGSSGSGRMLEAIAGSNALLVPL